MKTSFIKLFCLVLLFVSSIVKGATFDVPEELQKDFECMALNLHYEARGESTKGMIAVANVVMNRTENPNFPNSVCEVIYQKKQFSWVNSKTRLTFRTTSYKAKFIAYEAIVNKTLEDNTSGALYFHVTNLKTNWEYGKLHKTANIGNHVFYKYRSINANKKHRR